MSNKFELGKTYKLNPILSALMSMTMGAEYKGEDGVFKVEKVDADGSAYTDDITSKQIAARCHIPSHIVNDCEEIADAS